MGVWRFGASRCERALGKMLFALRRPTGRSRDGCVALKSIAKSPQASAAIQQAGITVIHGNPVFKEFKDS